MPRILLTGERGFLGSSIAAELTRRGHAFTTLPRRLEFLEPASLLADWVFHCAGALAHRPEDWQRANVVGTEKLLAALRPDARIIHLSSRSVYDGSGTSAITEDAPLAPASGYGHSKLAAERAVQASGHAYLILRATTLFGCAGNGTLGEFNFPAQALRALARREPVQVFEPDRLTDYLEVKTLARAMVDLLEFAPQWNRIYNLAGPARSLHGFIEDLAARANAAGLPTARLIHVPGPPPRGPVLDTRRWATVFGPLPTPDDTLVFDEMIERLNPNT
ncbi:MAG: sugar nucleotide-binding protein [Betaproteobacteria bacterium]|nr:sugar nucleotide-binding protein [Betaproteobacteria bacterium]